MSLGVDKLMNSVALHACLCCVFTCEVKNSSVYLYTVYVCVYWVDISLYNLYVCCVLVVVTPGVDGGEPGADHSYQSQIHHHGPAVWPVWPHLSRVVGWHPCRQLQSLCFLSGKMAACTADVPQFKQLLGWDTSKQTHSIVCKGACHWINTLLYTLIQTTMFTTGSCAGLVAHHLFRFWIQGTWNPAQCGPIFRFM